MMFDILIVLGRSWERPIFVWEVCLVEYRLIHSRRRTVAIQIAGEGVLVRAPLHMPVAAVNAFVDSRRAWIEKALAAMPERLPCFLPAELAELTRQAKRDLPARAAKYAPMLGVHYSRISIRHQKTRWGSCSSKKNLNFNCLLMLAPEWVRDYVVIHELCHLLEMNHSSKFWSLVEKAMPDYKEARKWLRTQGKALIARL